MKKKHLFFLAGVFVVIGIAFITFYSSEKNCKYIPRNDQEVFAEKGYRGALEWMHGRRADGEGKIDPVAERKAQAEANSLSKLKSNSETVVEWDEMGPDNVGGRTRALLYDMNNHNIIYAGAVSGGLWRSTTSGLAWNQSDLNVLDTNDVPVTNLNVSCITQAANGDIYFGTGEYNTANGSLSGLRGNGIWKSTDGITFKQLKSTCRTEQQQSIFRYVNAIGADPTDPNRIYAATHKGLRVTNDGGEVDFETVPEGISLSNSTKVCRDLKVAPDGSVITSINNKTFLSHDGGDTFFTSTSYPQSPNGRLEYGVSRTDPNFMYCHAAKSNGTLHNVYKSSDKGLTWKIIGEGGFNFQTLGNQGLYDNCIAVYPDDTAKIITGGQANMYTYSPEKLWEVVSSGYVEHGSLYYLFVHADQHTIVFHPDYGVENNKTILIGTDGGVFISENGGITFSSRNKNYNVTQFYTLATDGYGHVLGGTQDNGTQINLFNGNTDKNFFEVNGADGGYCEMSKLDPRVSFSSIYYGSMQRSQEKGRGFDTVGKYFYNNYILNRYWAGLEGNIGKKTEAGFGSAGFVTLYKLWEHQDDQNSIDSVTYTNTPTLLPLYAYDTFQDSINSTFTNVYIDTLHFTNSFGEKYIRANLIIGAGETIIAKSQINELPIEFELEYSLYPEEQIRIKDHYQAMLAIPLRNPSNGQWNIMLTRKPLHFNVLKELQPWSKILPEDIQTALQESAIPDSDPTTYGNWGMRDLEFSADGDHLFFAFYNTLFRVSGLSTARTRATLTADSTEYSLDVIQVASFTSNINGIAVDCNNPDNVMITLAGFGLNDNILLSENATSASPSFAGKQGSLTTKLPSAPVFDGIFNCMNPDQVMVATEFGIYTADNIFDINPDWVEQNNDKLGPVVTPAIYQQTWKNQATPHIENHGVVYIGTHGRGIFKTNVWAGPVAIDEPGNSVSSKLESLNVFPNPIENNAQIKFRLLSTEEVKVVVFDLQGKAVKHLNLGKYNPGYHTVNTSFSDLNTGTYLVNLYHGNRTLNKKVVVL